MVITEGNEAADPFVWFDTVKRSLICGLDGCLENYNKVFVFTKEPSHHIHCSPSHLISMERQAAGAMTLTNHSPFP